MSTRGKTRRYKINYDYICGKGIEPCWDCGKFTDNLNHRCLECSLKRMIIKQSSLLGTNKKND